MRRAARVDDNHREIVRALVRVGASVQDLSAVGGGCPDLVVGFGNVNYLLEIKDGEKTPSRRKLTGPQNTWFDGWTGQAAVVTSVDDAFNVIGATK